MTMVAGGIMLSLAGIICLIAALGQALQNRAYAGSSDLVSAKVMRKHTRLVKHGHVHELTVTYTVNGTEYTRVVAVPLSEFNAVAVGSETVLRYRTDKPKKAVPPSQLQPKNVRAVLIIGLVLLIAGVALFLIGQR